MKKVFTFLLLASSTSLLASCPQINGIFACTGFGFNQPGKIIKVESVVTDNGDNQVRVNNGAYFTEGQDGTFCRDGAYIMRSEDDKFKLERSLTLIDEDTLEEFFKLQASSNEEKGQTSTCIRLR